MPAGPDLHFVGLGHAPHAQRLFQKAIDRQHRGALADLLRIETDFLQQQAHGTARLEARELRFALDALTHELEDRRIAHVFATTAFVRAK